MGVVRGAVLDFVYEHPGAVGGSAARRLPALRARSRRRARAPRRAAAAFAEAIRVPLATVHDRPAGGIAATEPVENLTAVPTRPEQTNILFRLTEERYGRKATIITTNLDYDDWYAFSVARK